MYFCIHFSKILHLLQLALLNNIMHKIYETHLSNTNKLLRFVVGFNVHLKKLA
jgi:hypothetical protein